MLCRVLHRLDFDNVWMWKNCKLRLDDHSFAPLLHVTFKVSTYVVYYCSSLAPKFLCYMVFIGYLSSFYFLVTNILLLLNYIVSMLVSSTLTTNLFYSCYKLLVFNLLTRDIIPFSSSHFYLACYVMYFKIAMSLFLGSSMSPASILWVQYCWATSLSANWF